MWACAIDEHCEHDAARRATNRALVASHPDAQYMVGVRLARNRQLHDLTTDITQAYSGLTFPLKFPLRFQGWQWRRLSQLPPPGRRQRPAVEQAYEVHSPAERLSRPSNASRASYRRMLNSTPSAHSPTLATGFDPSNRFRPLMYPRNTCTEQCLLCFMVRCSVAPPSMALVMSPARRLWPP